MFHRFKLSFCHLQRSDLGKNRLLSAKTRKNTGCILKGHRSVTLKYFWNPLKRFISENHLVYEYNHLKSLLASEIPDSKNFRCGPRIVKERDR